MLAYVDDLYMIVTSPNYSENCRILESLHKEVMVWARENDISFDKYQVRHFKRSRTAKINGDDDYPRLPGLDGTDLQKEIRILGVIVDTQLRWDAHVELVSFMVGDRGPTLTDVTRSSQTSANR